MRIKCGCNMSFNQIMNELKAIKDTMHSVAEKMKT